MCSILQLLGKRSWTYRSVISAAIHGEWIVLNQPAVGISNIILSAYSRCTDGLVI